MTNQSNKSKSTYIVLALFLGALMVHRFYAGRTMSAIVFLVLSLCTFGGFGAFVALIDVVRAIGKGTDAHGNFIVK